MGSLAPEFVCDVFMSYCHAGKTDNPPLKQWSQNFHARLQSELQTLPDWPDTRIFIDDGGLDRGDALEQQIKDAIVGAALFLILMSPHYLGSKPCQRERGYWFDKIAAEHYPEVRNRLLVARVWPLRPNDAWPKELCDELGQPPLGLWFHQKPGDPDKTRPFGWIEKSKSDFDAQLVELVGEIAVRLRELRQSIERKRKTAANIRKLTAVDGQAIYVHGRENESPRWDKACKALLDAGYVVVPDKPESFSSNSLRQIQDLEYESVRTLTGCDGLLLVSGDNPTHFASDLVVVGRSRRNSARAATNKLLPCAVLDYGRLGDGTSLLRSSAENMNIRWITASSSDWVSGVGKWLSSAALSSQEPE
jgi:TIR domain